MSDSRKKKSSSSKNIDEKLLDTIKHYDSFYEKPPPGLVKQNDEERPEDVIPDTPENQAAREFLAKAPTKGLWMPLGKEVKVMKCWRCKIYGHRSGDKECPLFMSGNKAMEEFRYAHEDPMYNYVKENEMQEKLRKVEMLQKLLDSEQDNIDKNRKRKKKHRHRSSSKTKRKKEIKHRKKHRKHEESSSSPSSSSNSESSSDSSSNSEREKRHKKKKRSKSKDKSSKSKQKKIKKSSKHSQ